MTGAAGSEMNLSMSRPDSPGTPAGAEIPLPPGFSSIQTIAINSRGEAVGGLTPADGPVIPFLYSGGTIYDLSTVSSQLVGAVPSAINDRGEIVLNSGPQSSNSGGVTFLITAQPQPVGVNPAAGSGYSQSMAFTFTEVGGFAQLSVLNILINNALDGSQACYLAYNRAQNVVYLVDNAGVSLVGGDAGECGISQ